MLRFLLTCLVLFALPVLAESRSWPKDGNFSLIGPKGWTVSKPSQNSLHFTSDKCAFEIESEAQAVPITDPNFREQVRDAVDKRFRVVSEGETKVSGETAIECDLEGVDELKDYVGRFLVLTNGRRTWFITYSAPRAQAPDAFGAVQESLGSLQLR